MIFILFFFFVLRFVFRFLLVLEKWRESRILNKSLPKARMKQKVAQLTRKGKAREAQPPAQQHSYCHWRQTRPDGNNRLTHPPPTATSLQSLHMLSARCVRVSSPRDPTMAAAGERKATACASFRTCTLACSHTPDCQSATWHWREVRRRGCR